MAGRRPTARDLVALAALALLNEGPKHPYEIHQTVRERHFDFLTGLPRSLYHAVDRLIRAGFAVPVETSREGQRPERTVLRITEEGRDELRSWVRDLLTVPGEKDAFVAGITFSYVLEPSVLLMDLNVRATRLAGHAAEMDAQLRRLDGVLPRMLVLEAEYRRAMSEAESRWVESLITALESGEVDWDFLTDEGGAPDR
ncbi:PadR family transcriptional regulator [Spirillospora sp. CA-294931]|uniref:PadR family transcriptional regulator n=1 Tax=Spirillospora sp. CA-294931 TaxID=3240042 RepID=UPI003D90FDC8